MVYQKNTLNYIISFLAFLVIVISFFFLIKGGDYKNFIVFALASSSFFLGYFIRRRNDNLEKDNLETKKEEKNEIPLLQESKKIPQEFIDEQERFKKLFSENKEKENLQ